MKLPLLLSQFLYQYKKLNLQGIGSFVLDPSVVIPDGSDKDPHSIALGISFVNATIHNADDELIEFIKTHTGKMKPLASADLDFYLTSGLQLLNIGKPFYLDGIGTLIKNKQGKLDFTPGEYSTLRLDDSENEKREKAEKRQSLSETSHRVQPAQGNRSRQALLVAAFIAGIVIIGWGGYTLYKKNALPEPADTAVPPKTEAETPHTDSQTVAVNQPGTLQAKKTDTLATAVTAAALPATAAAASTTGTLYKFFILRTPDKTHALRRYNQLLSFDLNVKMETATDSSFFRLYFPITALNRDTIRIKDSLATNYAARVTIER